MKKAIKISLYILGSILFLLLMLFVFHSKIISYSLKKVIWNKSEGKVELTLDSFTLDLQDGSIYIDKPALILQDVFMNETKSISLDTINYEKIEILELNLFKLVKDRSIVAKKLLFDKPQFWFSEEGSESKSSFHPDKLINIINQNPDMFSRMLLRIEDIEIHYGSIMLTEYTAPEADPGLVDFTLMLEGFDSRPDGHDTINRILFSDEFRFRLKDFHKDLKSGYTLDIDSAIFSSNHRDLLIGGASLFPTEQNIEENSVGIKAGQIKLNDISLEEVRGLEDLSLRSIILADGEFINYHNVKSKTRNDTSASNLDQLSKLLYDFRLDSIDIKNFNYYNIHDFQDTVILTNDIEFLMTAIEIDSGMFEHLFRTLNYDKIELQTGNFAIRKLIPELNLSYRGLSYSNADRNLKLKGIKLTSEESGSKQKPIDLIVPELQITGVSFLKMQKREKQHLIVSILNPQGDFELSQLLPDSATEKKNPLFPGYLILDKIILRNGDFNIAKTDDFLVNLKGLNIELDDLKLPETVNEHFNFKQVSFSYDNVKSYFEIPGIDLTTGNLSYNTSLLDINNIKMKTGLFGKDGQLDIKKINLQDFDLNRLVFSNEFSLGQLIISTPNFVGDIAIKNNSPETGTQPIHDLLMPLSLEVGEIIFDKGQFETEVSLGNDTINLLTNYDLKLGRITSNKGDSLKSLLSALIWRLKLTDFKASAADHEIESSQILSDAFQSAFSIRNLSVSALPSALLNDNKPVIKSLALPGFELTGLNYNLLLEQDSLAFSKVLFDSLNVDISLPKSIPHAKSQQDEKLDLREYQIFSYDTIIANDMYVMVEKSDDSSNKHFSLKNFNLFHHFTSIEDANLMNNFGLSFSEYAQYDSIANKFVHIDEGRIELDENDLIIKGIRAGNIINKVDANSIGGSSGMLIQSNNIRLNDITIAEQLPSRLRIGKLLIGDFDLQLKQAPSKNKKTSFRINLELIDRFSNIMTRYSIDTTLLEDISLTYQTVLDTSMHTINFDSISLTVSKINIDTAMVNEKRPNLIDNLIVDLHGRTMISRDSLYEFRTGQLQYNFPKHLVTIDSFYMIPRYDEEVFFDRAVYQADRANLFCRKIEFNDIDLEELFNDNHIHLRNVDAHNLSAELFRNKLYPIKPGTYKLLPREALKGISQKFTIDSVRVIDSYLKYKQIEAKSLVPGEIHFTNLNASAYNLTNVLKSGQQLNLKLDANGMIMGTARVDVSVFFPLHTDTTAFWLTAKSESIDLTSLNSMTENLLGLGILNGIGSLDVNYISGSDSLARGNLVFRYKKLRLATYDRKKSELSKRFFSPLVNFLINDLVIKSNNPKFARKPRIGQVYFVRETEKGPVAYLFRSILSGMTSTLGFNNKEQRLDRKEDKKK